MSDFAFTLSAENYVQHDYEPIAMAGARAIVAAIKALDPIGQLLVMDVLTHDRDLTLGSFCLRFSTTPPKLSALI